MGADGFTARPAIFSIHDVMPLTLDATERIAAELADRGIERLTLLVVPDTGWKAAELARLRRLHGLGAALAGHGWRHRIAGIRNLRHWLHSLLLSRDVAEHLALDRQACLSLMRDCFAWFETNGLPSPSLYVPPAWAMGDIQNADLDELPYRQFETLSGIYDCASGRWSRTPMLGFAADTPLRALACRVWNRLNLTIGSGPLRVCIHPQDPELLLGDDLRRLLRLKWQDRYYDDVPATG